MDGRFERLSPLAGACFGSRIHLPGASDAAALVEAAKCDPAALPRALAESHGLLLLPGMAAMAEVPDMLLRLSRVFGPEVENYRTTGMAPNMVHPTVPEIFVVSNTPPVGRQPPPLPNPPLTEDGRLPVQYPHRHGWHTDQSYRRPPPDISLFLAVLPVPRGQGQTLFADGIAAYAALPEGLKAQVVGLEGLHVGSSAGRRREAVLAGVPPRELGLREQPQRQPVVRIHPVTGQPALYLCEHGQMDWLDGPFLGMQPGPEGDGAALLDRLMAHLTRPEFVYVHEWTPGDMVVWDNRCTVHAATWFDAEKEARVMWRNTVSGDPDAAYAGEAKSWLAEA